MHAREARKGRLARRLVPAALLGGLLLSIAACTAGDARPEWSVELLPAARPDVARIGEDVAWLAADARRGRRAGTAGERASALWLAARMDELGLEPAGTQGYLQPFEVPLPARDGGGSRVTLGDTTFLEGLAPLFCSAGGRAQGRLVFGCYGIEDDERRWHDLSALDLEGAIVLMVRGTPRRPAAPEGGATEAGAEPAHGGGEARGAAAAGGWGFGGSIFHKAMNAKRRGAVAVLVAQHPDDAGEPPLAFDPSRGDRAGIPALFVTSELASVLVPDYAARVAALDEGRAGGAALDAELALQADVERARGPAHNVLGRLPGRGGPTVVVGAHFDHLGLGDVGSLAPGELGQVHNGADDNASGTAAVLELARLLSEGPQPVGDVVFALWSGEELGLLGSEYWCGRPTVALEDVRGYVNLDMVGRASENGLIVLGAGTAKEFAAWLGPAGARAGLELDVSLSGRGVGGSDHMSFMKHEVPCLHLFTGLHADYHRPSDDAERVDSQGIARVVDLCLELVGRMQAAPALAYVDVREEEGEQQTGARGFRVRFGTVPDYAFEGPGLRLTGTSPGSPAERAGMIEGDVLVQVGDIRIDSIHDFVYCLQVHKPGDVVRAKFLRDGVEEEVLVTLDSRDVE